MIDFNPFPHNKILDQTKLKEFADSKLNKTKMIISVFDRVETLWEQFLLLRKEEITVNQYFLFISTVFSVLSCVFKYDLSEITLYELQK